MIFCFINILVKILHKLSYSVLSIILSCRDFDNPHAVAVDIGIAIKLIPVRDKVIELDVVAIMTNVSNYFTIVVIVL